MAVGSFFLCSPDCPKQPRTSIPFYKFFYPTISGRISDSPELLQPGERKIRKEQQKAAKTGKKEKQEAIILPPANIFHCRTSPSLGIKAIWLISSVAGAFLQVIHFQRMYFFYHYAQTYCKKILPDAGSITVF